NCINTSAVVNISNTSGATVSAISSSATCGASNGSITATGVGGTTPYQYSLDGITYQASNVFTGLAAGAYTVTIKDGNNCINTSAVVNIANTSGATVTAISSNATCGASNGIITATGVGGTTPYQYSLDGITYQASNVFTGLAAGAYTVTIKDANNCINTSAVVNIINTSGATVTAISSNSTCGASNGSITATGVGGTTPYQYSLDGITYQASNVFTGLAAGAYTVTIKDANNCINTSTLINVNSNSGATVTAISSNSTCGASNGSITATGIGGTTPYQYSLDGITYQASNVFTGLAAGAYTVTIKDGNNCINTSSIINVNSNSGATVTAISSNATCGASNGSITATGVGGTTPYQYSLDGITYQASNVFTGLAAGAYTVIIKDGNNCINTSSIINVNSNSGATVTAISSNATCGASNGSITVTGVGGTTPYQYSLDGITYQASNVFTGLAAGAYTVTIKDANNCINTSSIINVNSNSGATVTAISSNATCGASNGSITATGIGGTTPYQYSLDGITYQASNVFTGLAAGAYTVTIKDANNCISTSSIINVNSNSGATVTAISSNATCGSSNGSITATGIGGTTPYQYSLDGITYQASNVFTGLAAGAYTVTLKDANNCINTSSIVNVNSNSGATVTAISSNATCGSNNGSITASGVGGTTPYQYSLDGITYQASNVFTGLAAGAYTVTIKDANNCINTSAVVNIVNTSGATLTAISSNATCGVSNGSITATGVGGTTPYQYSLDGITYQASNVFTGLAAGAYTVTIKDANNCINTSSIINLNSNSGATVTAISSNATCGASNGSITATGVGGTTPYQYSLDGITYQANNVFTGLAAGAYTVTIKDANNCINTSSIININSNSGATVTAISSNATCGASTGSITATGIGGTTPYQFSLDGITYQASNVFIGLAAGAYTVTIKDANNCINTSSIINVNSNSGATVTAISSNTTCGASNGSITVNGVGGTTPYQYSLDGITYQANNVFTGLAAGAYTVTIKDANNCINTSSIININSNSGATVTAISSNATCGASNGSITATGVGGTTPYQYSLNGITYQASNVFTGLAAGAYTVTIKDANNCISTSSIININSNSGATVTAISSNATCGASNGSITVTGVGGTTPYQYSLNGITYQASNVFTGLAAGAYTVTIKDANNCISTSSIININSNSGATVTAISSNATCGASNGSITATGVGGTTPYQYSLDGITYQASNVFTGLAAGAYTVTIKDANNCINTSVVVNIVNTSGATVTAISSNATCGASNGSITATGVGGTTPYQYSLDGITYQASNVFTGLAAGAYTVTIKDANNCINTSVVVNIVNTSGATITAISSNATCGVSNGSITATGVGGTTPYQYSLDGITYQASNVFTGLTAGAYTVTIKDANNCTSSSVVITISQIAMLQLNASGTTTICNGQSAGLSAIAIGGIAPYTYSWSHGIIAANVLVNPSTTTNYSVFVRDSSNCISAIQTLTVTVRAPLSIIVSPNDTICEGSTALLNATVSGGTGGPYHYHWLNLADTTATIAVSPLVSSTYQVTAGDGCTSPDVGAAVFVKVNPKPPVDFSISPDEGCEPLIVTLQNLINAGPGSSYLWNFGDTSLGQGNQNIHQYEHHGVYSVSLTVNSAEGCTNTLVKNNSVHVYPKPHANFIANPWESTLVNATIKFTDISSGATHWQWEFGDVFGTSFNQNAVYQYNDTGHYQVKLSIENNYGCSDTAYGEVLILGEFTYYVPNSFSPNNDGVNDFFEGGGIGIVSEELSIYDRWGILLYYEQGNKPKWDGKNQSDKKEVQEDVYIYEIVVKDIFNKSHRYSGQLTLFR
ncbi:MAG TPA: PKD domain-containing protein, partial [Bacteroidia bacterium]|nr:PKD domain-containing protein [Bacteroidia bacterium]